MGLYIVNKDGNVIGWVDTNAEANALLETVPDDIYTFFVGGFPDEVQTFMLRLNTADTEGLTFFDRLSQKYGRVPESINPLQEIKDIFLRYTTFFIKLRGPLLSDRTVGQMFSVLQRTLPAGSAFFVLIDRGSIEEGLVDIAQEGTDVFYALDVAEAVAADNFSDRILAESVI